VQPYESLRAEGRELDGKSVHDAIPPLIRRSRISSAAVDSAAGRECREARLSRKIGGTVRLLVVRVDHVALIEVKDNGVGMPPIMIEKLLNPSMHKK